MTLNDKIVYEDATAYCYELVRKILLTVQHF